jgi:DNA-directed RNA polymerase I, II, and III subunit RPABC3
VSRISAHSKVNKLVIELDINTEIYPVEENTFYKMVLASSVNADGSDTFDIIRYENEGSSTGMGSLIDQYDYVMHGKVFKYQLTNDEKKM